VNGVIVDDLKLLLQDIPEGHSGIERTVPAEALDLEGWVPAGSPVRLTLEADRRGQQITFRGRVTARSRTACARCSEDAELDLEADLILLADRRGSDSARDEATLEQDGSVLYHEGVELDLGPPVREALILEVPQVVLCRPDCLGLCPHCGENRNETACRCTPKSGDPRWEALKSLKDSSNQE